MAARDARAGRRFGDIVVELGFTDRQTVESAVVAAREAGCTTGQMLLRRGVLTDEQVSHAVAARYGIERLDIASLEIDMGALNLLSPGMSRRYGAVPVGFADDGALLVAMVDPSNVLGLDDIALATGLEIRALLATTDEIGLLLDNASRLQDTVLETVEEEVEEPLPAASTAVDLESSAQDAPVIKLVHSIIARAVERGASDIHFDPEERGMVVRFRVDGITVDAATIPRSHVAGVVSRLKIMTSLDISERRLPQDGRVGLKVEKRHIDVRAVTLPLVRGEAVVLRLLDQSGARLDLDDIGMGADERARFRSGFARANGTVLVTGPTGSGKTTTLYSALQEINTREKTIAAIEDPVEYEIEGVKQVQVNAKTGLTFAAGLRAMLRADPDVMLVGEIRDGETAHTAVEAALTGHLVLSTLHTNDAPSAITRLVDMGTEPFLVASAVRCVVAQRLVRTLCTHCREPVSIPAEALLSEFGVDEAIDAFEAVGCRRCGDSGYSGRKGIYEVMLMTDELRELTMRGASAEELGAAARREGLGSMRADGLAKVRAGLTSIAEVTRVVGSR